MLPYLQTYNLDTDNNKIYLRDVSMLLFIFLRTQCALLLSEMDKKQHRNVQQINFIIICF